jgi:hypothetical protein
LDLGTDFESVAWLWISEQRHVIVNVCTSAALWAIWKLRNEFCFQGMRWTGVQVLMRRCSWMLRLEIDKPKRRCREAGGRIGKKLCTA